MNPMAYHAELLDMIKAATSERDEQREPGPSEVGTPCERKLAYKLWNVEPTNGQQGDKWRARVGTAVHKQLEGVFGEREEIIQTDDESPAAFRFFTERKVTVGTWQDGVRTRTLRGSADLFDTMPLWLEGHETVVDFKTSSPSKIADYARGKIPEVYRVQNQCYGQGYVNEGYNVKWVALLFLPRDDELNLATSVLHIEPFDASVAQAALRRLEIVAAKSHAGDYASLPIAQDFCSRCPWYRHSAAPILANKGMCSGAIKHSGLDHADPFSFS